MLCLSRRHSDLRCIICLSYPSVQFTPVCTMKGEPVKYIVEFIPSKSWQNSHQSFIKEQLIAIKEITQSHLKWSTVLVKRLYNTKETGKQKSMLWTRLPCPMSSAAEQYHRYRNQQRQWLCLVCHFPDLLYALTFYGMSIPNRRKG